MTEDSWYEFHKPTDVKATFRRFCADRYDQLVAEIALLEAILEYVAYVRINNLATGPAVVRYYVAGKEDPCEVREPVLKHALRRVIMRARIERDEVSR